MTVTNTSSFCFERGLDFWTQDLSRRSDGFFPHIVLRRRETQRQRRSHCIHSVSQKHSEFTSMTILLFYISLYVQHFLVYYDQRLYSWQLSFYGLLFLKQLKYRDHISTNKLTYFYYYRGLQRLLTDSSHRGTGLICKSSDFLNGTCL